MNKYNFEEQLKKTFEQVAKLQEEGKTEEAMSIVERSLDKAEKAYGKKNPIVAVLLASLSLHYFANRKFSESATLCQKSLKIADTTDDQNVKFFIYSLIGFLHGIVSETLANNWSGAIDDYQKVRALLFKLGQLDDSVKDSMQKLYAEVGWRLGICLKKTDRWLEALAVQEENFKAFKKLGELKWEADVYMEIGHLHQLLDNYEESWLHYLDAYRLYSRANDGKGDKVGMASASEALGTLEFYARMLPQSVKDLKEAHKLYKSLDLPDKVASVEKTLKEARKALKEEEPVTIS